METHVDNDIPQWKKDLIARLRNQNRTVAAAGSTDQQLCLSPQLSSSGRAGHQPSLTCKSESVTSGVLCPSVSEECNVIPKATCSQPTHSKMVQERVWMDNKHDPFAEMVSENYNNNGYHKDSDSDSSEEDLHYGPGIVNKLKNKYLSLALRESNRVRPCILHMRRATSLENLLDDDLPNGNRRTRQFQTRLGDNDIGKNIPNRYRNAAHVEMKRARSVEAISRCDNHVPLIPTEVRPNRQSLHEEMLIAVEKEGNDHPHRKMQDNHLETNAEHTLSSNNVGHRINRPKRIQPIMNEKEKPPADVVKQTKMIFERRPEQRTKAPPHTGDVAAKVDCFNHIIVKSKVECQVISKKTTVKHTKPVLNDKVKCNTRPVAKPVVVSEEISKCTQHIPPPKNLELNKVTKKELKEDAPLSSPIPDVSRIEFHNKGENERGKNLSETPDLILVSSPLPPAVSSPTYKKNITDIFMKEEIRNSSPILHSPLSPNRATSPLLSPNRFKPASPHLSPIKNTPPSPILSPTKLKPGPDGDAVDGPGYKMVPPTVVNNISKQASGTAVFNFTNKAATQSHLPPVNKNVSHTKTPPSQPLKIEVNGHNETKIPTSTPKLLLTQSPKSPPLPPRVVEKKPEPAKVLTVTEIEKNLINTVKTLQQPSKGSVVSVNSSVEVVNKNLVPKKGLRPREPESNTAVFNFTSRKDVPDYISNDRSRSPGRPELPKPGEGGIILIPGATIHDSFTDEEEEILRSLEGPPSPCDVTFINDNILIDGKSSLSQKTRRTKLKISFVDAGPDVYEYPSENSLLLDDSPPSPAQIGHTVPILSGSSLATYTPKAMEEFHPGVTRSVQESKPDVAEAEATTELVIEEMDQPFSSGTNSDMLF